MTSRFDTVAHEWDKGDLRQLIAARTAETILQHVPLKSEMDLLDFGAGTGLLTYKIAPHVHSVTAVDTSTKMLDVLLEKKHKDHLIKAACCDITQMPLDQTFDGIISSMAMHHVEDTKHFLKTLKAHLNPGGFIAIADLDKEDGSFHAHGNDGVFHFGFERETLSGMAAESGFERTAFHTALTIEKPSGDYPIFLMTAYASAS